ncbi:MAG TPA: hypothetical protein ENO30_05015 [Thermodesulfobium narugense]|nr:hypothetical protein [Thermodesulfobium narugense]
MDRHCFQPDDKTRYVLINIDYVKLLLRELYKATKVNNLFSMINKASVSKNENIKAYVYCLRTLIELDASGYAKPPIEWQDMLDEVIAEFEDKSNKTL